MTENPLHFTLTRSLDISQNELPADELAGSRPEDPSGSRLYQRARSPVDSDAGGLRREGRSIGGATVIGSETDVTPVAHIPLAGGVVQSIGMSGSAELFLGKQFANVDASDNNIYDSDAYTAHYRSIFIDELTTAIERTDAGQPVTTARTYFWKEIAAFIPYRRSNTYLKSLAHLNAFTTYLTAVSEKQEFSNELEIIEYLLKNDVSLASEHSALTPGHDTFRNGLPKTFNDAGPLFELLPFYTLKSDIKLKLVLERPDANGNFREYSSQFFTFRHSTWYVGDEPLAVIPAGVRFTLSIVNIPSGHEARLYYFTNPASNSISGPLSTRATVAGGFMGAGYTIWVQCSEEFKLPDNDLNALLDQLVTPEPFLDTSVVDADNSCYWPAYKWHLYVNDDVRQDSFQFEWLYASVIRGEDVEYKTSSQIYAGNALNKAEALLFLQAVLDFNNKPAFDPGNPTNPDNKTAAEVKYNTEYWHDAFWSVELKSFAYIDRQRTSMLGE